MSAPKPFRCDVAIAGGGMVGLSLAAALSELPLDVAVIEPVLPASAAQPSFDSRTTALSNGSRRVLEGIGAWAGIASQATPIRRIHVSERGSFGTAVLTAEEQGVAALGHTIENRLLGRALRERVAASPRIRLVHAGVAAIQPGADAIQLTTDAGERGDARLLVAADGAQSAVRAALGIEASDLGLRPARDHRARRHGAVSRLHGL